MDINKIKEEFNKKFIIDHGDFGKTLLLYNSIDEISDWWLSKIQQRDAEVKKALVEKILVELDKMSGVSINFAEITGPKLICLEEVKEKIKQI